LFAEWLIVFRMVAVVLAVLDVGGIASYLAITISPSAILPVLLAV
jgi:uncharacterized membrane protein YtjA (UPF0391 family)